MLNRRLLLAGVAGLASLPRPGAAETVFDEQPWGTFLREGLYLPMLRHFLAIAANDPKRIAQQLAQWSAMVGDEAAAFALWRGGRPSKPATFDLTDAISVDAVDAIAEAARGRRVVIVNEAHHVSRCRAFGAVVARRLRQDGFNWFAAETFSNEPEYDFARVANAGGPITTEAGYYLADPVFAEMVRQAREVGYRLAAYEMTNAQREAADPAPDQRIATREEAESDNLIANVLNKDPDARVLVYCGFAHAAKSPLRGQSWMAALLKAKTGIDPLCVEQSASGPDPVDIDYFADVTRVLERFAPRAPIALSRADGSALSITFDGAVDIAVYHPRLADIDGRPGWLATAPDRVRQVFALPSAAGPGDRLVQAVPLAETSAPNAIPSDQYMAKPGAKEAVFFLRPGRYEIHMETDAGRQVLGKITVP